MEILDTSRCDCRVWAHTSSGIFSVASAWDALRIKAAPTQWGWAIWQRCLQPRSSVFGWRLVHGALPIDDKMRRRIVALVSRKLKVIPLPKVWGPLIIIICHQIWLERNRQRYDNLKRTHSQVVNLCFREVSDCACIEGVKVNSVHDLILARKLRVVITKSPAKIIIEVKWKHPLIGWWKLNIDGSSLGNPGSIGAGGIFRNHFGTPIRCFASFQGVGTNFMAEMAASKVGIKEARELCISKLWIESDSTATVTIILSRMIPWCLMQYWWSISPFPDSIQWRITHCYREANVAVDALANHAAKGEISSIWQATPIFISQAVSWDALGWPYYRFT
ncbi:uncharacterized protein LOC122665651 [Telopea speciosissima]|uniref:uncharacterized protein LOC122665651 n=1 Tax=Telopea speciosissima TaxID=54955 RepID=UPI001CC6ECEC|nr:uncharacterized protein LOC122665651 [Telopea speciosissima]